jgi:uncharacterized membrane protein (DUF485 family)
MCFFFSLLPATFWLVIGYFVMFSSTKLEGGMQLFGKILAIWIFVIASVIPLAGAYMAISDACPMEAMMEELIEEIAEEMAEDD